MCASNDEWDRGQRVRFVADGAAHVRRLVVVPHELTARDARSMLLGLLRRGGLELVGLGGDVLVEVLLVLQRALAGHRREEPGVLQLMGHLPGVSMR